MATADGQQSWWAKVFGRSVLSMLFGTFFEKKANAASIIALLLIATVCYFVIFREKGEAYLPQLLNIAFVVIGYYFGSKQASVNRDEEA